MNVFWWAYHLGMSSVTQTNADVLEMTYFVSGGTWNLNSIRSTQPPTQGGMGNEYRPKCGDALRLGSKVM